MYIVILLYLTSLSISFSNGDQCDRKYFIPNVKATRFQAHQMCRSKGANLVSIENREQDLKLRAQLKALGQPHTYYWMSGLSYWKESSSHWWYDNIGRDMVYSSWCTDVGQPQESKGTFHYREPCIAADFRGEVFCFHDYPCFAMHYFICATSCKSDVPRIPIQYGEFCIRYERVPQNRAVEKCKEISRSQTLINLETTHKMERLALYYRTYPPKSVVTWVNLKRQSKSSNVFLWNSGHGPYATFTLWEDTYPRLDEFECVFATFKNGYFYLSDVNCNPDVKLYYVCE